MEHVKLLQGTLEFRAGAALCYAVSKIRAAIRMHTHVMRRCTWACALKPILFHVDTEPFPLARARGDREVLNSLKNETLALNERPSDSTIFLKKLRHVAYIAETADAFQRDADREGGRVRVNTRTHTHVHT